MDISETLAPNSDQLDAVDLLGGPRTFTITQVTRGNAEQPVNIHLAEFPRVWRPGKSMRRVLASAWGTDATVYVGRRVTLYCDESVKFGGKAVGGTRIKALSHIDQPKTVPLLVSRGQSAMFTVQPIKERDGHSGVIDAAVTKAKLADVPPPVESDKPLILDDSDEPTPLSKPQLGKILALFGDIGWSDKADMLRATQALVGRNVESANDLTKTEASKLIDELETVANSDDPSGALTDTLEALSG